MWQSIQLVHIYSSQTIPRQLKNFFLLQYDQETSVEFYAIKSSGKDEEPAFFLI